MGNYHSNADLKARFPDDYAVAQLTGVDSAETGVPDEDVLTEIVNGTEGVVDSYLNGRYLVPVAVADHATLAAHMKSLCLDISVYRLEKDGSGVVPEEHFKAWEAAIAWLKDVSMGKANLPTPDTEASSESNDPQVEWGIAEIGESGDPDKYNRGFTRSSMRSL